MVCQYVTDFLTEHGHQVKMDRGEHFSATSLTGHDLLILGCSTYEHGELEDHFRYNFWPRIQDIDLAKQKCAVIGLGDSKYDTDYNIESGRLLSEYVETHNGQLVCENLMIDKCPLPQLQSTVRAWVDTLNSQL